MPARLDDASNLRFLYACMAHSNYTTISYEDVATLFGIKAPAARMRLTRLKDQLDPGQRIGHKHIKISKAEARRRRQKEKRRQDAKEGYEATWKGGRDGEYGPNIDEVEVEDDEEAGWTIGDMQNKMDGGEDVSKFHPTEKPVAIRRNSSRPRQMVGGHANGMLTAWSQHNYTGPHREVLDEDPPIVSGRRYPPPMPPTMHWSHPHYAPPLQSSSSTLAERGLTSTHALNYSTSRYHGLPSGQSPILGDAFDFDRAETILSSGVDVDLDLKESSPKVSIKSTEGGWETQSNHSNAESGAQVSFYGAGRGAVERDHKRVQWSREI